MSNLLWLGIWLYFGIQDIGLEWHYAKKDPTQEIVTYGNKIEVQGTGVERKRDKLSTRRVYRSLPVDGRIPGTRTRGWRKLARRVRPTTNNNNNNYLLIALYLFFFLR